MSKTSAKNRYTQLMSWLQTRKNKSINSKQQSRLTHYKNKNNVK